MIDEGLAKIDAAIAAKCPGPYQVQAAIAALHARAPRPEDTDWPQIATLYLRAEGDVAITGDRAEQSSRGRNGRRTRCRPRPDGAACRRARPLSLVPCSPG